MKNYFFFILAFGFIKSQGQKLDFHINPGFILAQVDGDGYGGYKKLSFSLGAGFKTKNQNKETFLDWSTRINQKGYREVNDFTFDKVTLTYLETDVVYGKTIKGKIDLGMGAYFGYLLTNFRTTRRTDLAPLIRVGVKISEKTSIQSRFAWSVLSIRQKNYSSWLNRTLLFELNYSLR